MKKKMMIILLCVVLVFSMLAACGHDHDNPCIEAECCDAHIDGVDCHCHGRCGTNGCDCHGAH